MSYEEKQKQMLDFMAAEDTKYGDDNQHYFHTLKHTLGMRPALINNNVGDQKNIVMLVEGIKVFKF